MQIALGSSVAGYGAINTNVIACIFNAQLHLTLLAESLHPSTRHAISSFPSHLRSIRCIPPSSSMSLVADHVRAAYHDKQTHIVLFSSTAIALYGYDQGLM
jgi:hypothetical protein